MTMRAISPAQRFLPRGPEKSIARITYLSWGVLGHIREGDKDMYVTSGIGTSILPVRFNMPPEIALLTIRGWR